MKLIQVVPTLESEASGPSYSVPRLSEGLAELGHEVVLLSAGGQAVSLSERLRFQRHPRNLGQVPLVRLLELSEGLRRGIAQEAITADLIHANGLWTAPTLYPAWAARALQKPFVVSPRGTLSPVALRRSAIRKKLFWALLQRKGVGQAAVIHATSEAEFHDIRAFGLTQPVAVIPNGVDLPAPIKHVPVRGVKRLLYLGRLHPIKGLEAMLTAWNNVSRDFLDWELRVVGPGTDDYRRLLSQMVRAQEMPRVEFGQPAYGPDKLREYAQADLFILPSFSENFGMTVAEALAQDTPVIATTGTPWHGLTLHGCGWQVEATAEALAGAMRAAMSLDREALRKRGRRGRAWMKDEFSWERVASDIAGVYSWILNGGEPPATVRVT